MIRYLSLPPNKQVHHPYIRRYEACLTQLREKVKSLPDMPKEPQKRKNPKANAKKGVQPQDLAGPKLIQPTLFEYFSKQPEVEFI